MMSRILCAACACLFLLGSVHAQEAKSPPAPAAASQPTGPADAQGREIPRELRDDSHVSHGSIAAAGGRIAYQAEAGILVVYTKDPYDDDPPVEDPKSPAPPPARQEAGMSYVAYFRGDKPDPSRPITFVYNGGPGSSTVWLHMGAFGPRRVVTADDSHNLAAPYQLVDNAWTLLDATDLVFVDAPGTGFGVLRGKDKEKAFWGVDQDAHAFANFITTFLSRHGRWNSPKYLFGESYGTTRSAVLAYVLESEKSLDLNGVILLSQILNFDNSVDGPQDNPSIDQPYVLALPTYAATAWYHHRLPDQPADLEPFLAEVEQFALGDYAAALAAGSQLSPERRSQIAARLHQYTGLPQDYIERADLRVNGGEFEKTLQGAEITTGRLDTRFSGPTLDPMSKEAEYDPQSAAISSAYVSSFNDYVRSTLGFGQDREYKAENNAIVTWDFQHQPPDQNTKLPQTTNVMPDLADAMKLNPHLRLMVNGGYYDLATPFFAAQYELNHLAIPAALRANIETRFYRSGHMVYAHEPALKELHDNVAAFIGRTH
jgi:carboxypeptidase C (cathepsin A)